MAGEYEGEDVTYNGVGRKTGLGEEIWNEMLEHGLSGDGYGPRRLACLVVGFWLWLLLLARSSRLER